MASPKKPKAGTKSLPNSESEEDNTVNINHYVADPRDHTKFIGKVERTRRGFRGLFFVKAVSLDEIKKGVSRMTRGRPLIRDAIHKVKFAMAHLYTQQDSQDVTT